MVVASALRRFFTLAAMPELIPMLREDVQQALIASKGEFTNQSMQNMRKLDSFMKENLRYYPLASGVSFPPSTHDTPTLSAYGNEHDLAN